MLGVGIRISRKARVLAGKKRKERNLVTWAEAKQINRDKIRECARGS